MARRWSAGCYGVARRREGSRQNSIGPRIILNSYALRARGRGWPGRGLPVATGARKTVGGGARAALGAPLFLNITHCAREGADGQAVVCRLLREIGAPTGGEREQNS